MTLVAYEDMKKTKRVEAKENYSKFMKMIQAKGFRFETYSNGFQLKVFTPCGDFYVWPTTDKYIEKIDGVSRSKQGAHLFVASCWRPSE